MQQELALMNSAPENALIDSRSERRRRTLKSGLILFNDGFASFECVVRNQSEDGFKVELENSFLVPNDIVFSLSGGECVPATVVWRKAKSLGVKLLTK